MKIGIDASRTFFLERTGIEEYSYQVIKHLTDKLNEHQVFLYIRKNQEVGFKLPNNWKIKTIKWPIFWTQIGLSLEMLLHPIDVLLVPAHTIPLVHAKKTIVVVHGLEFEKMPEAYSFWGRLYMRLSIKKSCFWANKIIAVSKNTKKDLIELYKVPDNKIKVIYEGVSTNYESSTNIRMTPNTKYLLFIGRLEKRKNIEGIISAFKILKEKYKIPHQLILAGKPGYGYQNLKFTKDIIETGYISEEKKYSLLKNASVFLFPTFYEGFGLPILEAQNFGVPVVASNTSSIPEVGGDSVAYADPYEPIAIAHAAYKIISDADYRNDIIEKGHKNVKRFSWEKCASAIAAVMLIHE